MSNPMDQASKCNHALASEKLRRLPPSATVDFDLFCSEHDEAALTRLIIAVLVDLSPTKGGGVVDWNDEVRLIEDVGFDSLAVAETIFFFEDLFEISISNDEIASLQNIGGLRAFVARKVKVAAA